MIKCELCGFESNASKLTSHLRQKHNLSCEEYLQKFPNASINNDSIDLCPICNKGFKYLRLHINKSHPKEYLDLYKEIDKSDDNEYVTCKVCGERKKQLNIHLQQIHNMTAEEYLNKYPNSELCSLSFRKSQSDASKSGKKLENIINRNKSDKQRQIISDRNKDPEFIKKCKEGIKNSDTWHDAHSKGAHERNIRMWKDPEYAKKMSNLLPSKYGRKCKYYSEIFNKEFSLKSNSELSFLRICEKNKDNWNITDIRYEEFYIKYIKDGIEHSYYPDFFIYVNNKLRYIVEVKWDEGNKDGNNKFKSSAAILYCQDNNIVYCWFKSRYNSQINNLDEISLMPK